jgi:hypothetical protein
LIGRPCRAAGVARIAVDPAIRAWLRESHPHSSDMPPSHPWGQESMQVAMGRAIGEAIEKGRG